MEDDPNFNVYNVRNKKTSLRQIKNVNKYQKVRHFPSAFQLSNKSHFWFNMSRLRCKFPKDFNISPISYVLAQKDENEEFEMQRQLNPSSLWICKPINGTDAKGIKIVDGQTHVPNRLGIRNSYIASNYIDNPHLINGYKYDFRVFALVTSFNPLKVYIYQDGLVCFCSEAYSTSGLCIKNRTSHFTNNSVNWHNRDKVSLNWNFKQYRDECEKLGINFDDIWKQIKDVVVKTLLTAEGHVTSALNEHPSARKACFEMLGFDIMLDDQMKAWVLEVNDWPQNYMEDEVTQNFTDRRVCDELTLLGIQPYDKLKVQSQPAEDTKLRQFKKSMSIQDLMFKDGGMLKGYENLTEDELDMLLDLEDEASRCNRFERVFPVPSTMDYYSQFFEHKRYENVLMMTYLRSTEKAKNKILKNHKRAFPTVV